MAIFGRIARFATIPNSFSSPGPEEYPAVHRGHANCAQPELEEVPAVRIVHFRGKMNSDIQMDTFLDAVLSCPNLVEVMVSRLPRAQL